MDQPEPKELILRSAMAPRTEAHVLGTGSELRSPTGEMDDFDLDTALVNLVGENIASEEIHFDDAYLNELQKHAKDIGVETKLHGTCEDLEPVKRLMWAFYMLKPTDLYRVNKKVRIALTLLIITNYDSKLPNDIQQVGKALLTLFRSMNWGRPVKKVEGSHPSTALRQERIEPSNGQTHIKKSESGKDKRFRGKLPTVKLMKDKDQPKKFEIQLPSKLEPKRGEDSIFGPRGIMHHITVNKKLRRSYGLDESFERRNFRVHGHNGFTIGDCWPLQIAALRDGVHGRKVGGICGSRHTGAYSIVISGAYGALDLDNGQQLHYCSANPSKSNLSQHELQYVNDGVYILRRSFETRNPLRVLRSSSAKWAGAPATGLRYDGLYVVVAHEQKRNESGGYYAIFKLVRKSDQDPIDVKKPDAAQIREFESVRTA